MNFGGLGIAEWLGYVEMQGRRSVVGRMASEQDEPSSTHGGRFGSQKAGIEI